ncbi:MAG: isoprenylcysteine carboxylmethyltransferase family protein [Rhizobiales bacterium]|nr:isoprenylcysteine carboxylmethyltransferase family protein [Hyphomicrobiales bacterium]
MTENNPTNGAPDNAGVKIPPPLIFLGCLLVGLGDDSPWLNFQLAETWMMVIGGLITAAGIVLILKGAPRHKAAGSNVEPWKPTTTIMTDGLYGWSRNPIYLGMAIIHAGLALSGGSLAALVTLAPAILAIRFYVIAREERYLEAKFGDEYLAYKAKVRRWI